MLEAFVIAFIAVAGIGAGTSTFGPNDRVAPIEGQQAVVSEKTGKVLYYNVKH